MSNHYAPCLCWIGVLTLCAGCAAPPRATSQPATNLPHDAATDRAAWIRYEVLWPIAFNDLRPVPSNWLDHALAEIVEQFGATSYETQRIEGQWRHEGRIYRDDLVKLVIDAADTAEARAWMQNFKQRWKAKLQQVDLWMISYSIRLE